MLSCRLSNCLYAKCVLFSDFWMGDGQFPEIIKFCFWENWVVMLVSGTHSLSLSNIFQRSLWKGTSYLSLTFLGGPIIFFFVDRGPYLVVFISSGPKLSYLRTSSNASWLVELLQVEILFLFR